MMGTSVYEPRWEGVMEVRLVARETTELRGELLAMTWYCLLGRLRADSRWLPVPKDWVEPERVCMKGTPRGVLYWLEASDMVLGRSLVVLLVVATDAFFLWLGRAVKWSSRGFMSGGMVLIFWNM